MLGRTRTLLGAIALTTFVAACRDATTPTAPALAPSFAKGGGGGAPAPGTHCGRITVTNNGQAVRHAVMPDVRYNLESCGTAAIAVTVTVTEAPGFLSNICPAPVAAPAHAALDAGKKLSATLPVFRGGCGMTSNVNGTVVQGINAWQGHNLLLTLTDDGNGTVLGTAFFSWQDVFGQGP